MGFEFNNFVDIGYKLDFKWSFLEGKDIQPYTYACIHGGISDVILLALHFGYGFDYFFSDKAYMIIDARLGPSIESGDPAKDPVSGERNYEYHVEGALSFGIGYLFGTSSKK